MSLNIDRIGLWCLVLVVQCVFLVPVYGAGNYTCAGVETGVCGEPCQLQV